MVNVPAVDGLFFALRRVKNPARTGTSDVFVTARYPKVKYRSKSSGSESNAGMILLTETATRAHGTNNHAPECGWAATRVRPALTGNGRRSRRR